MSSRGSEVDEGNKYEQEFTEFLLKRIGNLGGSVQLQHLTGHLSQLSFDLRCHIGTSPADVMQFLKTRKDLFSVQNGIVRLVDSASSKDGGYDSDCSSVEPFSSLPMLINKGKGVVIKIFPEFGFIRIKEPIKTDAYFRASSFGDKNVDLTSSLYIGSMVYFNAKKKTSNESKSKYFATRVWKVDDNDKLSNAVVTRTRKNHETGLYDPMILESDGYIQRVFPNLGFIAVKGDESNTVFFYKNRLLKYDNIVDLTKVLSKGDYVEFSAHRSTKPDSKARWEATKVWKKSSKIKEVNSSKSESIPNKETSEVGTRSKNRSKEKEMIKNQQGKICPRAQGSVIKFGQNDIADGDGSTYYMNGTQVTDISWEFCDGDDVFFDAVKIKSPPGWKAVLVWTGKRPNIILPTCLGDFTEFTDEETDDNFSSVLSNSSNSSLKSASLKSGNSSSKVKNHQGNSLKSSQYEEKRLSKENFKSQKSPSHYGSQSSLSSSVVSRSSEKSKKGQKMESSNRKKSSNENKISSCWGDSPYFSDVNDQTVATPDSFSCASQEVSKHENVKNDFEDVPRKKSFNEEGEISKIKVNELSDMLNNVDDESESKSKSENYQKACIRNFQCLEGRIVKVYSKFAEVQSKKLPNIVSFHWNNFYFRGVSIEELDVDDLKQVLKVGDSVHFNYFEIIDDSGQNWQKVSMAWSGPKPKQAAETTADDFIKQNNLSVSIIDEVIVDDEQEKVVSRKFLSAYEDEDPEELLDEASNSESYSEDELPSTKDNLTVSEPSSPTVSAMDNSIVLNEIIGILRKDLTLSKLKVDLKSISEEILNIVLENQKQKGCISELDSEFLLSEKSVSAVSDTSCTNCAKKSMSNSSSQVKTINSEVQTIITGDIIAQNIFTEC